MSNIKIKIMTPSFYAEGLLETLKHIDNAIKSASVVVSADSPLMKNLFAYRNDILDKLSPWIKPLGQVLSQINNGLGTWVINTEDNKYYQFIDTTSRGGGLYVNLIRHNGNVMFETSARVFDKLFRLADPLEVTQHEEFLMNKIGRKTLVSLKGKPDVTSVKVAVTEKTQTPVSKPSIDPSKCEFYMVTCTGQHGSKVRHTSYELAEKEAMRIANVKKHPAWVVGVVAKIEPEVKTTFNVKKSW